MIKVEREKKWPNLKVVYDFTEAETWATEHQSLFVSLQQQQWAKKLKLIKSPCGLYSSLACNWIEEGGVLNPD